MFKLQNVPNAIISTEISGYAIRFVVIVGVDVVVVVVEQLNVALVVVVVIVVEVKVVVVSSFYCSFGC